MAVSSNVLKGPSVKGTMYSRATTEDPEDWEDREATAFAKKGKVDITHTGSVFELAVHNLYQRTGEAKTGFSSRKKKNVEYEKHTRIPHLFLPGYASLTTQAIFALLPDANTG